jgi:epoxyqueuosine reductase
LGSNHNIAQSQNVISPSSYEVYVMTTILPTHAHTEPADDASAADAAVYRALGAELKGWALALGFQDVGVTDLALDEHEDHLQRWLDKGYQGEMGYMAAHGNMRSHPEQLVPGAIRAITLRMDYLPPDTQPLTMLASSADAYVARYALGRDYHKVIRQRLVKLWAKMQDYLAEHNITHHHSRVFTDSAPLLEKALAEKSGLGWIGKNTLLLNQSAGSLFFLGEMLTDVPLPLTTPAPGNHCGSCNRCIDVCPTAAIIAPYQLDARRCISYLTIEHRGSIPEEFRAAIGNRIFGCDDCQLFCPWNKFAQVSEVEDFTPRNGLDNEALLTLFAWTEAEFLTRTTGSAIRRTGYEGWRRNIAIALGNCEGGAEVTAALTASLVNASALLREHVEWALSHLADRHKDAID